MKIGTYKEGDYITTYYGDGTVWQCMQNPLCPIKNWDDLPEGYKFPEPDYSSVFGESKLEFLDFGSTPPRVLTAEEVKELYNE